MVLVMVGNGNGLVLQFRSMPKSKPLGTDVSVVFSLGLITIKIFKEIFLIVNFLKIND